MRDTRRKPRRGEKANPIPLSVNGFDGVAVGDIITMEFYRIVNGKPTVTEDKRYPYCYFVFVGDQG